MICYFQGTRGISDVLGRTDLLLRWALANNCEVIYDLRPIVGPENDFSQLFSLNFEGLITDPAEIDEKSDSAIELVLDFDERDDIAKTCGGWQTLWFLMMC
jgi:hypothetical protein